MRRCLAMAAVVAALMAVPAQARAAGIHAFRVVDAGTTIEWGISVCTQPGLQVHFKLRLEDDVGLVETYNGGGTQTYRCTRWRWSRVDDFPSGDYYGRIKVRIPATGLVRYTRWKSFYIR